MKLRLGAHVSVGKGLIASLDKARDMGANCLQIFTSPPQSFLMSKFSDSDCAQFKRRAIALDIQPVFIHATYLINLASEKKRLLESSILSLIDDLTIAGKIGARGSIVHTGSHKGAGFEKAMPVVVDAIKKVLAKTPPNTKLYLEIASGGKGKIGATFEELAILLKTVGGKRVGVCLDTAHMFAAGFALDTNQKLDELTQKIGDTVGWETIDCMHANDSKVEFGSGRDRHENIGKGFIGIEPFRLLLQHKQFSQLPFILETPGFDGKGPDKENLDILRSLT